MKIKLGDEVRLLERIVNRDAYFKSNTRPGATRITLEIGSVLIAAMDELGGNVVIEATTPKGEAVYVMLAQGEFAAA